MTQEQLLAMRDHEREQRRQDWIALSQAAKNVIWAAAGAYVLVYLSQWVPGLVTQILESFK